MPYRNIFIANKSDLRVKNHQLIVDNGEVFSFPLEDIRSVLIDNCCCMLSSNLICALSRYGVCLMLCNEKHMPVCQLLPISSYCRMNKRISLQFKQTKPKLKRMWQAIVQAKIKNQARCLEMNSIEECKKLYSISSSVFSGDTTNREGYAANLYFKALFGSNFTRGEENSTNAALNYGYAIIRSFISKTLVAEGFEPSLGIHHKSQLNAFNLSDDVIEPFRPVVDNFVFNNISECGDFSTCEKAQLLKLLNCKMKVNGDICSLSTAVNLMIQSIITSFENSDIELKLPEITETEYFNYD